MSDHGGEDGGFMNRGAQRICASCGFLVIALFLIGFILSGFLIPPSPTDPEGYSRVIN
jgi:hypothetical protein